MKKSAVPILLFFCLLGALPSQWVSAAPVVLMGEEGLRLESNTIEEAPSRRIVGEPLRYRIEISRHGAGDIDTPSVPKLKNLKFINLEISERASEDQRSRIFTYHFVPKTPGLARVGDVEVNYSLEGKDDKRTLTAPGLDFVILKPGPSLSLFLSVAGGFLIALVLAITLGRRRLTRRHDLALKEKEIRPLDPGEKAAQKWEDFRKMVIEGRRQEMVLEARRDLLDWLSSRISQCSIQKMTTPEILEKVEAEEALGGSRSRVKNILRLAESVKYGAYQPAQEECDLILKDWSELFPRNASEE